MTRLQSIQSQKLITEQTPTYRINSQQQRLDRKKVKIKKKKYCKPLKYCSNER